MPPRLRDYDLKDWSRLRPLTHALKTRRYRRVDAIYAREPARDGNVGALIAHARGRKLLLTIGYADAQAIDWQVELVRHYLPDVLHAVADNSPDDASALAIKFMAGAHGIPYLRLPPNRWPEGSRSHGLALNWLWLTVAALAGIYFLYSATVEERDMTEQFPDNYPVYKRSTKMLVPLIL